MSAGIDRLSIIFMVTVLALTVAGIRVYDHFKTPESKVAFDFKKFCKSGDLLKMSPSRRSLCGRGIFLNRDNVKALESLPSIGPGRARQIVGFRRKNGPFRSPSELMKVKGIGPSTVRKIRPWLESVSIP
jgi:hypothetical protein